MFDKVEVYTTYTHNALDAARTTGLSTCAAVECPATSSTSSWSLWTSQRVLRMSSKGSLFCLWRTDKSVWLCHRKNL